VKTAFKPEFVNRIDEVVVFHALDEKHIQSIAKIQLGYLEKRLEAMDMQLQVDEAVLREIAQVGFDPVFGARPLKRAIQAQIENPLAREILEGHFGAKDVVRVGMRGGTVTFSKGLKEAEQQASA
jgi:ATP-dependent Clp protease ATP-binding subunit ClpB